MSVDQIINGALHAIELAWALLSPEDQDRLAQRTREVLDAKKRVRDFAQSKLDERKKA